MIVNSIIIVLHLSYCKIMEAIEINEESLNFIPDYDFSWAKEKESELRRRFLDKKQENKDQDYRIKLFEKLSNTTLYEDEIMHSVVSKRYPRYKNFKKYETLFRNVLTMKGVKYVFKRDFFWRTWRRVGDNSSIVFYKCNSFNTSNAYWGHWSIEENPPPCPYEIFSMIETRKICVVKYTELLLPITSCPLKVALEELLSSCNNPIETKWRILRDYSADVRTIDICQGKDSCEITTLYMINPDSIAFRIINESNHIVYSRVMKTGQRNYACDQDCGIIDPKTKIIRKTDDHIVFNLLKVNQKNKRENNIKQSFHNRFLKKPVFANSVHYPKKNIDKKPMKIATKSPCKLFEDSYLLQNEEKDSDYDYPVEMILN